MLIDNPKARAAMGIPEPKSLLTDVAPPKKGQMPEPAAPPAPTGSPDKIKDNASSKLF